MVLEMVMLECDCEFECEWLHNVTDSKYYIKCSLNSTHSTIKTHRDTVTKHIEDT